MTPDLIIAAIIFGLITGFHCIGMCGPIAISLPLKDNNWLQKSWGGIVYNLGRVITYSLMGALFGMIGQGFKFAGFQQWLSIAIGFIMIISVLFPLLFEKFANKSPLFSLVEKIKTKLGLLFAIRKNSSLFFIGFLNGFLPCGPVYVAIGLSLASGSILAGAVYMALFGLGTIPVMLTLALVGNFISGTVRTRIRKFVPVFILILGFWFILKGAGLGIQYLSPAEKKLEINSKPSKSCCSTIVFRY